MRGRAATGAFDVGDLAELRDDLLRLRLTAAAFLVGLSFFCGRANAIGPDGPPEAQHATAPRDSGRAVRPGVYVPPNEQHPAVALPILERSNHGVYVSVGGERSFMGAAVTQAQALVVVDYDPEIVRFAQINRALLAASRDREDYLVLRLKSDAEVWRGRAASVPEDDRNTLADPESWKFWDRVVRKNTSAWSEAFEHFHTLPKAPTDPFAQCNYLFDDGLYARVRRLARASLIWARLLDLRHENEVRKLCADLRAKGWPLGVVDTSNVADASEAGSASAGRYVAWLSECAEDTTIFMNTERASRASVSYWTYFAFTGKTLKGRDASSIARWYDIEIRKFGADPQTRAVVDDPDAVK